MSAKITLLFSLLFRKANAINITKLLNQYPDFSTFNDYITKTGLATDINSFQTITVLVVDNSNISLLSGKSNAAIKKILSVHAWQAIGQQGFLNVTDVNTGSVAIDSAEKARKTPSSPKKSPPSDSLSPSKSPGLPPQPSDAPVADSPAHDSPSEGTTLQPRLLSCL
ncbi:unnamed protein product [Fraxinus pennsylvanica]|uniref:FAS1 domain-containing protein n=1 Tax=Fraxinus pennsylvanica TaxID=56036 RepID=A0AAD1ZPQ6_9LAMI|nr:unnamed protein product [Fraxinus pennsylvanica]